MDNNIDAFNQQRQFVKQNVSETQNNFSYTKKIQDVPMNKDTRVIRKNTSTRQAMEGRAHHGKGRIQRGNVPNVETKKQTFVQTVQQWIGKQFTGSSAATVRSRIDPRTGQKASASYCEKSYTGNAKSSSHSGMTGRTIQSTPSTKTETKLKYMGTPYQDGAKIQNKKAYNLPETGRETAQIDAINNATISGISRSQMPMQDDVQSTQRQFTNVDGHDFGIVSVGTQSVAFNQEDMLLEPTMREQLIKQADNRNISSSGKAKVYNPSEFAPDPTIRESTGSQPLNNIVQSNLINVI